MPRRTECPRSERTESADFAPNLETFLQLRRRNVTGTLPAAMDNRTPGKGMRANRQNSDSVSQSRIVALTGDLGTREGKPLLSSMPSSGPLSNCPLDERGPASVLSGGDTIALGMSVDLFRPSSRSSQARPASPRDATLIGNSSPFFADMTALAKSCEPVLSEVPSTEEVTMAATPTPPLSFRRPNAPEQVSHGVADVLPDLSDGMDWSAPPAGQSRRLGPLVAILILVGLTVGATIGFLVIRYGLPEWR